MAVSLLLAEDGIPVLVPPIQGLNVSNLRDTYTEDRGGHLHEAIDIMTPRGTPTQAVVSGTIKKLFLSKPGGNTIYLFDDAQIYCYYYAHLDRYAPGLREGAHVNAGEVIAYSGFSGNADASAPHLHFAVFKLGPGKEWWKGEPINPYSRLAEAVRRSH